MSEHKPPAFQARHKSEETGDWENVGAAWNTAKKDVLSVKMTKQVESFILVPNKPKPAAKAAGKKPSGNAPK